MSLFVNLVFHFQSTIQRLFSISSTISEEPTFFDFLWNYLSIYKHYVLLFITVIVIIYVVEWVRYKIKLHRHINNDTVNLGSINISGELSKIINPREVEVIITSEFNAIKECLNNMKREVVNSSPAQATSVDYYFFFSGIEGNLGSTRQRSPIPEIKGLKKNPVFQSNIILGFGSFKIPVSEILRSFIAIIGLLPVRPRKRYFRYLINISIISYKKNAKIVVHRGGVKKVSKRNKDLEEKKCRIEDKYENNLITVEEKERLLKQLEIDKDNLEVLSVTNLSSCKSTGELDSLLRDLAFMVLDLQNTFQGFNWKSLRYLLDGFIDFASFRNSGSLEDRNNAKEKFKKAIAYDPENNHHALFYYSVMLMVDRTATAIEQAKNYFKMALRTKDQKLQALIHLGLAFCYSQSYHRLGKRDKDTIENAYNSIKKASELWSIRLKFNKYQEKLNLSSQKNIANTRLSDINQLPLIPYMEAMIRFVKADHIEDKNEKAKVLNEALTFAYESTKRDPLNSMFKNNIGWALMRMVESEIETIEEGILPDENRNTAYLSEKYLLDALEMNPNNKLTNANLCYLYSLPCFVKKNDDDEYGLIFLKSRFYGLKAIKLDENYINAYRDLCFTYIRYNKIDLAEEYYFKALKLAEYPGKDAEIVIDTLNEAKRNKLPKDVMKKWTDLDPQLFEPH